jgi:hypothetical protein
LKLDKVIVKDCRLEEVEGAISPIVVGCEFVGEIDDKIKMKIATLVFELNMTFFFRDLYINLYRYVKYQFHNGIEVLFILAQAIIID